MCVNIVWNYLPPLVDMCIKLWGLLVIRHTLGRLVQLVAFYKAPNKCEIHLNLVDEEGNFFFLYLLNYEINCKKKSKLYSIRILIFNIRDEHTG